MMPRESIEECNLPEEVFDMTKVPDIDSFLSFERWLLFEKDARPTIRELLESDDLSLILRSLEVGEMWMEEEHSVELRYKNEKI